MAPPGSYVPTSNNNLGTVYSKTGDLEKAKEEHEWALKISQEQLGANDVDVTTSYNNLGNLYRNTGDGEKAKEYHEWALKIRNEQLGANHVDVAACYYNFGVEATSRFGDTLAHLLPPPGRILCA